MWEKMLCWGERCCQRKQWCERNMEQKRYCAQYVYVSVSVMFNLNKKHDPRVFCMSLSADECLNIHATVYVDPCCIEIMPVIRCKLYYIYT